MIAKKYDRGGSTKPKYSKARGKEQSPEERLSDAIASQGRGAKDLMYMLSAMRSPTSIERKAEMFDPSRRFKSKGRAFENNRKAMYQRPSDVEGKYEGSGALPTRKDVRDITGGRGDMGSRVETEVAKMLRDPAVIRYFMDLYGESGKQKRSKTVSLGGRGKSASECEIEFKSGNVSSECKAFARNMKG
jgi:hypothetical protein